MSHQFTPLQILRSHLIRLYEYGQAWWLQNHKKLLLQRQRWLGRLVFWVFGSLAGLAAVSFALLAGETTRFFLDLTRYHPWIPFLFTPVAGVILLWITRTFFRGIEGSGIPQVIAEMKPKPPGTPWRPLVSLRIAIGKMLVGAAAIGGGFSLGREGPTVQIGACLMAAAGRFLPAGLSIQRHHLLVAGGAAGIAAAFNTPLAGIVFAIEELSRSIESRMSGVVITAIVLAGIIAQTYLGNHAYFGQVAVFGETPSLALTILVCALASGLAGGLFSRMLLLSASGWESRIAKLRRSNPYCFMMACGLLVAAIGWASGGVTWCSGYEQTRALLEGSQAVPWYFGPAKFAATVLAYLSGLPGGIFAPSLAIGAGIGQNMSQLLVGQAYPATVIVLCMVGFLAAATQAPITSFIIVMEMVSGYPIVIGMMATALIASAISRALSRPLYQTLATYLVDAQYSAEGKKFPDTSSHPKQAS